MPNILIEKSIMVADIVPAELARRVASGEKPIDTEVPLDVDGALTELPLATHPLILEYAAFYLDWLAHPTADDYWLPSDPSRVCELRLDLWATANVFLPGHRIRLEVSSSNFPRFDRNSNTGGVIASEARDRYQPAINRIFHDAAHPSHVILPISDTEHRREMNSTALATWEKRVPTQRKESRNEHQTKRFTTFRKRTG